MQLGLYQQILLSPAVKCCRLLIRDEYGTVNEEFPYRHPLSPKQKKKTPNNLGEGKLLFWLAAA